MTLHLWDRARDPEPFHAPGETKPVICGRRVSYQQITRNLDNVTCPECDKLLASTPDPRSPTWTGERPS